MNQAQLSFNGGEVSPYLRHRIDFEKTASSAETMENFLSHPIGTLMKRPGLKHLTTLTHDTSKGCMFPFVASDGTSYLICIDEANGITIVRAANATVADTVAFLSDSTIPNTFISGTHSMRELSFIAINDVAFLTHSAIAPTRLTRRSDTDWICETIPFTYPPLGIANTDEDSVIIVARNGASPTAWSSSHGAYAVGDLVTYNSLEWVCTKAHTASSTTYPVEGPTIYNGSLPNGYYTFLISGSGFTYKPIWKQNLAVSIVGETINLTSNKGIFTSSMVGSKFLFSRERIASESQIIQLLNSPDRTSTVIYIERKWAITTFGTWSGTVKIEKSLDGSTWTQFRTYYSAANRNVSDAGELDEPAFVRINWDYDAAGSSSPMAVLDCLDTFLNGFFEIASVTNSTTATAIAKTLVFPSTSWIWTEAAFTKHNGFPAVSALHESRLVFAGTTSQPTSLWISQSDDLLNFLTGPNESDAIASTLAAPGSDPIRWVASQRRLFIGTSRAEYVSGSETLDQPISPTNFTARRYTNAGSRRRRPLVYADGLLFTGRNGGRLYEIGYDQSRQNYSTDDLTRLAEHLTQPGISNMAYQQGREQMIWLVREDGVLLNFLYSRAERIASWSRHSTTGGLFKDVAIIPNDTGDDDVFFLIKRGSLTCLERFNAGWQAANETNANWLALDGIQGTTNATVTIPVHLRSTELTKLTDGDTNPIAEQTAYLSSTASIHAGDWQIGFPIVGTYKSLPIDITAQDGSTSGRKKRIHKLALSLVNARGGKISNKSIAAAVPIPNTQPSAVLRTGWEEVIPDSGNVNDAQIVITHSDPFPFSLRAAVIKWQLHEP